MSTYPWADKGGKGGAAALRAGSVQKSAGPRRLHSLERRARLLSKLTVNVSKSVVVGGCGN